MCAFYNRDRVRDGGDKRQHPENNTRYRYARGTFSLLHIRRLYGLATLYYNCAHYHPLER